MKIARSSRILMESLEGRDLLSAAPSLAHLPSAIHVGNLAPRLHAIAGQDFTGKLATLEHPGAGTVSATIDWGDGTTSDATITRRGGIVIISGEHTWAAEGLYAITVAVSRTPPRGPGPNTFFPVLLGSISRTAIVAEAPTPSAGGSQYVTTVGQRYVGPVGGFTFQNVDLILSPQINWGDGTTSAGSLEGGLLAGGNYTVIGTHTYGQTGTFTVHVIVRSRVAGSPTGFPTGTVAEYDSVIQVVAATQV